MRGRLSWHLFAFQQYSTNDSVQKYLEGMTKNPCIAVCLYCVYICVCRKMHRLTVHVVILHKHKTSWESKTNEHYSQKLFFYCLAKHLGYFIVLYVVLQTTSRKRGRWGLIKIVMGTELVRGEKTLTSTFSNRCFPLPLSNWEKVINAHALWEGKHDKEISIQSHNPVGHIQCHQFYLLLSCPLGKMQLEWEKLKRRLFDYSAWVNRVCGR